MPTAKARPSRQHATGQENFAPPIIDRGKIDDLEAASSSKARGQQRRTMLTMCAADAEKLSALSLDNPAAFDEMRELIEAFAEHARGLAELAERAVQRLALLDRRKGKRSPLH